MRPAGSKLTRRALLAGMPALLAAPALRATPVAVRLQRVQLFDAAQAGGRLVAVGERGAAFVSDDAGLHWQQAVNPVEADLTAVTLLPGGAAWAVGHRGTVLRSPDGGRSWQAASVSVPEQNSLFDVVADGPRGWAVGAFGVLAQTDDDGARWAGRRVLGDDFDKHLYGIARTAEGTLWIVGEGGTLLRSTDQGAGWSAMPSPYIGSFFGIAVLDEGRLLVHGMRGHVYRSDDAGRRWARVGVPEGLSIQGARRVGPGTVTLAGLDGAVFLSRDNGTTFAMQPPVDRHAVRVALARDAATLLAFGEGGFYPLPIARA